MYTCNTIHIIHVLQLNSINYKLAVIFDYILSITLFLLTNSFLNNCLWQSFPLIYTHQIDNICTTLFVLLLVR